MSLDQKCAFLTRLINMFSLCEEPDHCTECLNLMSCTVDNMRKMNGRNFNLNYMSAIDPPVILLKRLKAKASITIKPKVKKIIPPKKVTIVVPAVSVTKIDQDIESEPLDETVTSHKSQTDTVGTNTDFTDTNGQTMDETNSVHEFIEKIRKKKSEDESEEDDENTMHDNSYDSGSHNFKFIDASGKRFATFFSDIKS